ncbi:glycosyltransferase family 4 protein [Gottfriedia acidiceleris]|uniref:glycosyltransferase family 4 protein n=1 Tax=Gottfriedia acidiceleris TaxID=371036 RepID=UPI0013EBCAD5|nr:glycosyltransferase family 4 protein [Gottfriedia acidiceleris]
MKVLIVGPSLKLKGGISSVLNNYNENINLFTNKNCDVEILGTINSKNKYKQLLDFMIFLLKFSIKVLGTDIVHIHTASYGSFTRKSILAMICKKINVPYIIHLHGAEFDLFYAKSSKKKKINIKNYFNNAAKIVVLGEQWKKVVSEFTDNVANITILNNAVPLPKNKKYKTESNSKLVLGFLGEIGVRKGIYDLVNCIDQISIERELILQIAGNGEIDKLKDHINEKVNSHRFNIIGWINSEEKKKFLNSIDILVLPSYNEGLPMSILEAMSYGKPIISSSVGSISEAVLEGENGFLIEPGEINQLYKSIFEFIEKPYLKEIMGEKSRNIFYERFSLNNHINQLIGVYKGVLITNE